MFYTVLKQTLSVTEVLKLIKSYTQWQGLILALLICMCTVPLLAQKASHNTLRLYKLSPQLEALNHTPATVRVLVKHKSSFIKWMKDQQLNISIVSIYGEPNILEVSELDTLSWQKLLQNPWTEYIDRPNRIPQEELELKDADFSVNKIYTLHSKRSQLNGEGLAVSIKEGAFDPNDIDLRGRVIEPDKNGNNYTIHATTMATLIAGGGNSGPRGKGVAHRTKLSYSNFAELMPDNSTELLKKGVSVQNHSYGVGLENYYGIESAAYDRQVYENPEILHVFSSGNSGNKTNTNGNYASVKNVANLTGQFKTSKNTLSVGALDLNGEVGQLSSRGPAYDGRIKPELVAYGVGGTSEAAAVVSGIALLVQQAYTNLSGDILPPASLVKAVLINSADDAGRPAVDFETGFGNANALNAIRTIEQQRFFTGNVSTNEEKKFILHVPPGAGQLKVTLVWHEGPASPTAQSALINDLDLKLQNTDTGEIWEPWILNSFPHLDSLKLPAKRGTDRINNIEQITIAAPATGNYELLVKGYSVISDAQNFSLVYEYNTSEEWLYPAANTALLANKLYAISWQTTKETGTARLEYRHVPDHDWIIVQPAIDVSQKSFIWSVPDTAAIMQLRLITDTSIIESEEFIVSKLLKLQVGFICDDQVMVHWKGMHNAQQYQLLLMGDKYLEPLLTTSDTLAVLSRNTFQNLSSEIAVQPFIQNRPGQNSRTVALEQSGVYCYIKSFLPELFVQNTVAFQLELSTLYDLATISLERKEKNDYIEISHLTPTQLIYELFDPLAMPGKNTYRVKLITKAGKVYYSQPEDIIYASDKYIQAYPNPVNRGESLNIVVESATAQIQVLDRTGKLMYDSIESSMIKSIPTNNFPRGLYIVRVLTDENILSVKIVVM